MSTAAGAKTSAAKGAAPEATRPRTVDYLLMLVGVGLSALLAALSGLQAGPSAAGPLRQAFLRALPLLLLLPLGILLLWPLFYTTQKIVGRRQELTLGEWLWGLAWLEALVLTVWILWRGLGSAPAFMATQEFRRGLMIGHLLFVVSTGGLAVVLYVIGLFGRWSVPWTHSFGLALLLWPLVPLALWGMMGIRLE